MNKELVSLMGEAPCPIEVFKQFVGISLSRNLAMLLPEKNLRLEAGMHAHSSYEFLLPFSPWTSRVGKRIIAVKPYKLIPLNFEEEHGPLSEMSECRFLAFNIKKEFVQDIANLIYGRNHVVFELDGYTIDTTLNYLIRSFMEESRTRQTGSEFILESISSQIVAKLMQQIKSNLPTTTSDKKYGEKENINRVIDFLQENYNSEYTLEDIAKIANLSPYHFIKVFKMQTGKTPFQYLLDTKIDNAEGMLKYTNRPITDVCYSCGFNSLSHFTKVFKKKLGMSPSEYRKEIL